jgi:ribose transport system substrate-binding protein
VTFKALPKVAMAVVAGIAAASLAACSSGGTSGTSGTSSAAGSTASTASAQSAGVAYAKAQLAQYESLRNTYGTPPAVTNAPNLHGKTIWYIPLGAIGVLSVMGTAMGQAMANLGATVHICNGQFEPTQVAACMQEAATQGAAAVVTSFVDYASIPSAYQALAAKHIPVLVGGEAAPPGVTATKDLGFYNPTNATNTSFNLMSDAVIADSNGTANVLVVTLDDSPSTIQASDAGVTVLKQHCPDCTVTTVGFLTADESKLASDISAKLSANPDINYLILPQDPMYQFALPGLQSAGFTNKVKVVTAAGSTYGLEEVKAGHIAYDIGQGAQYEGWGFADDTVRLLAGAAIQPATVGAVRVFNSANVGSLSLTDANYDTSAWYGGTEWQQQFLNAWNGK